MNKAETRAEHIDAALYSIPPQYLDPNHPDQIDYGSCVLRLPK